ncbi:MAG: helix-turn-helix domain-containing protein [Oscillospiraceae bacterium]
MSDEKNPQQSSPAYWAVIPAAVRYDSELRPNAKLLYGEISALASAGGFCYAHNKYFADLYGFNPKTVSALIGSLAKAGYIIVELCRTQKGNIDMRKIWLTGRALSLCPPPPQKMDTPPSNNGDPPPQKVEENSTRDNSKTPIAPKIAPKVVTDTLAEYAAGDAKLLDALLGFAEMRTKIRAPITTARTVALLIAKLDNLSGGSNGLKIAMLDEATLKSWKTVYAPKGAGLVEKVEEGEDVEQW